MNPLPNLFPPGSATDADGMLVIGGWWWLTARTMSIG
jgi:hypothetical protein